MGGSKALENAFDMIRYVDENKIEGGIVEVRCSRRRNFCNDGPNK